MEKNNFKYGGQALIEGVMMQGATGLAIAVRDNEGVIRTKTIKQTKQKSIFYKIPVVRGVFYFVRSMTTGVKVLTDSARVVAADENGEGEKLGFALFLAVALALAISVGLFILLPNIITSLLIRIFKLSLTDIGKNLIEGVIKIGIFVLYLALVSVLKDIRRTFMYHGAEHRVINAYEQGLDLTVENVQKMTTFHPRCGTSFMFFVLAISIVVFSFFGWQTNPLARLGIRLAMLPLVAGLSYEFLKLLALSNSPLLFPFKAPGFLLQKLSTKVPDEFMAEVAIVAFNKAYALDNDPNSVEEDFIVAKKLAEVRADITAKYEHKGIEMGNDPNWILADVLKCKMGDLKPDIMISAKQQDYINEVINRRATGEPLQYILGYTEFFGHKIIVDKSVLIPRAETELVAEEVINAVNEVKTATNELASTAQDGGELTTAVDGGELTTAVPTVLDLCTGSGAIAIAVQKATNVKVVASDISPEAIALATKNAQDMNATIDFFVGNLFDNITGKFDIIVSNPPYITTADMHTLQKEVTFEPPLALNGGTDGLVIYRKIITQAKNFLHQGGTLIMEIGYNQGEQVSSLLTEHGYNDVTIKKDYSKNDRIIKAKC